MDMGWGWWGQQDPRLLQVSPYSLPPCLGVLLPNMAIVSGGNFSVKSSLGLVDSLVSVAATQICHCSSGHTMSERAVF